METEPGVHRGFIERFGELQGIVAGILISAIVVIVTYGAIVRYVFRAPAAWSIELPSLLFLIAIALGLAYTQSKRGHATVDTVVTRLPLSVQRVLEVACIVLFLFYAIVVAWSGWNLAAHDLQVGQRAMISKFPLFASDVFIPVGFLFLSIQLVVDAVRRIKGFEVGDHHV